MCLSGARVFQEKEMAAGSLPLCSLKFRMKEADNKQTECQSWALSAFQVSIHLTLTTSREVLLSPFPSRTETEIQKG